MDWKDLLGDPGGYLTGTNTQGFGGVKKMIFGDPDAIKKAYDQLIGEAKAGGADIRDWLQGQKGQAQQYFQPLSNMFTAAYGTQGIQAPQTPPPVLSSMYK